MGYTHVEIMPITEHPLDAILGISNYRILFSRHSRYGNAKEFKVFIDNCHKNGIGVILDWVPIVISVKIAHGLYMFDGTSNL